MIYLNNKKILSYFLLIFPPSLVTGPFLPDFILSLSSIYFITYLIINKKIYFLLSDFSKIFILFYIFIFLRSFFTEEMLFSLKNTFFYFRFIIFAYLLKYLIQKDKNFAKMFISFLLFTLVIISLDALIEYFRGSHWLFDKTSYSENDNNRISGLFDEEYILGSFIIALFPTALIIFFKKKNLNKTHLVYLFFLIIVFIFTIIITGERSSFVKLFLLLFTVILFTSILGSLKKKLGILIVTFSIILFTIVSQPKLNERLIYHTFDLLLQNTDNNKIDRNLSILEHLKQIEVKDLTYFSKEHRDHAIVSIRMFNDSKIFGHGVKTFRFKCAEKKYYLNSRSCTTHSHGIVLTFLSEIGMIGIAFLTVIYFYLIKNIFKSNTDINKIILISIFIYLFPLLPSGYFFNNYFSIILYTLVGIYLGFKKIYKIS